MRCEMFVWTIFSWLILLGNVPLSFCSSCSEEYFEDQEIDFDQISKAGETIKPLGTINASSVEECAKSCCEYVSENCNVVTYSRNRTDSCSLYFCQPNSHCFLKESLQHVYTIKLKLFDTTTSSNSTSTLPTSYLTNISATRLKTTTDRTDTTAVTPDWNATTIINNLTRIEYAPPLNFTLKAESTTYNSAETSPDASSTSKKEEEGSRVTTDIDITSIPLTKTTASVYIGSSFDSEGSINSTTPTTTELVTREDETELSTVKDKDDISSIFNVTVKTKLMMSNETEPQIFDVTVKTKLMLNNETEQLLNVSVTTGLVVDYNKTEEGGIVPAELSGESDQFKKDVHLIVGLVIGLLILLTVLGLVVRRFYDGWQRRHYQRMDFLIDGMYNSPSS